MRRALVLVLLCVACDSRAKASDPTKPEQKSKEYESCGASMHCADGLRCFDQTCRRTARSTVGDYFAALGAERLANRDVAQAVESYNRALGHYDTEKLAVPPDIDCAYGHALAADRDKKDSAELGARVLHRCILALPPGSQYREHALADLATLHESGLEPLSLGRTSLADVYLTRAPQAPSTDKLTVTVTPTPTPSGKTFSLVTERLAAPDIRPAMVACWEAYNKAAKKDALTATVNVKSSYQPSEYDDEAGTFSMKVEGASAPGGSPEAAANDCVKAAVEPVLKDLKGIRDAFTTKLVVVVK